MLFNLNNMKEHQLQFPFNSRYFTHGDLNPQTEQVWIVFHGYGQLAKYFINNFSSLDPKSHFVISPEGTNRFYLEGFDGRVGASWMTKEARETDIQNYLTQLDCLVDSFRNRIPHKAIINVLGFSQGTATASRWLSLSNPEIHNLILWAGKFAFDIDLNSIREYLSTIHIYVVVGDEDQYIDEAKFLEYQGFLIQHQVQFESIKFKGGHKILEDTLIQLSNTF